MFVLERRISCVGVCLAIVLVCRFDLICFDKWSRDYQLNIKFQRVSTRVILPRGVVVDNLQAYWLAGTW